MANSSISLNCRKGQFLRSADFDYRTNINYPDLKIIYLLEKEELKSYQPHLVKGFYQFFGEMGEMKSEEYLNKIIQRDALTTLKRLPDEILDVGITSPPYNKGENKKGWLVTSVKYSGASDRLPKEFYQKNQVAVLNEEDGMGNSARGNLG